MINFSEISPYGICGVGGFLCGIAYLFFACKRDGQSLEDMVYVYVWAALGAVIGAKLLYLAVESKAIASYIAAYGGLGFDDVKGLVGGGFVFYGGLLGAIAATAIACRYFRYDADETFRLLAPVMPLAHAFGRIGCTVVGCCYGVETDGVLGIVYSHSEYAPAGVRLFPVQPVEAACDILIFLCLICFFKKNYGGKLILEIYLVMYACVRFTLEFFRGDSARGVWWGLSTSQWISLAIVAVVIAVISRDHRRVRACKDV